jgi:CRAL/TRIO domain
VSFYPADDFFLLPYLRRNKFCMSDVTEFYEKTMTVLQTHPEWIKNLNFEDKKLREIYESGCLVPLKERDENGCRVLLYRFAEADLKKYELVDYCRLSALIAVTDILDPETQVAGIVGVLDTKQVTVEKHLSQLSLKDTLDFALRAQEGVPFRLKKIVVFNVPSVAAFITDVSKTFMSQKMKDRLIVSSTEKAFTDSFDVKIFPKEYGGTIPIKDMLDDFKTKIQTQIENIRLLSEQEIDLSKVKAVKDHVGSFRTLEID